MTDPLNVVPTAPMTPGTDTQRTRATLPPYMLAKARSRLSFLSLLFAGMCVVGLGIDQFLKDFYAQSIYPVFVFNGITSTLLFVLTRQRNVSDRVVLNLGLVYEILMCLSVTMGFTWDQYQTTGTPPSVTWVCIVLVAYPLIVPTHPARTTLVAVTGAATVPLGLFILASLELVTPRPFDYFDVSFSPALCVVLAVMGSRVVYGLSCEVARARQLGSYQLIERLGGGGMGEVWRAKHRLLARPAAVKLMRPELQTQLSHDNRRMAERFRREALVTADLVSPHTVDLYDFGTTDEGVFYYVMELLTGLDLETLVRTHGSLLPERVAHVLLQACHSLREAHARGLVHRDIKPANLFLCWQRACDYDVVKVLDFGLVALRPDLHSGDPRLTVTGHVDGTPAYMPPEAITEDHVDARADIYALGCVGYWLLTGHVVFETETPVKAAIAHVREVPVAPSQRTQTEIPAALERLILSCLEKDPGRRPQSASALAETLLASGLPTAWTQDRAREWWRTHRPHGVRPHAEDVTSDSPTVPAH